MNLHNLRLQIFVARWNIQKFYYDLEYPLLIIYRFIKFSKTWIVEIAVRLW